MATRLAAILAVIPIVLFAAMVGALPGPATALQVQSTSSLPMPNLRAELFQGRLVLSGTLPDHSERAAMAREAGATYGRDHVVDHMTIGAVGNPAWLSPAYLPDLRDLSRAVAVLEDAQLVVDGVAPSAQAFDRLSMRLHQLERRGLRVVNRVVVDAQFAAR